MVPISIFGQKNCIYCEKAMYLCEERGYNYNYYDIADAENKEALLEALPNVKTVPQIWWNGNYIGGYTEFAQEVENVGSFGQDKL